MAEALARDRMKEEWEGKVEFSSAGTLDLGGSEASPLAVEVMSELGVDLSRHRSTHLTEELIESSELIVPMAGRHRDVITMLVPGVEERVILLGKLDPEREEVDIRDPIGGDRLIYRQARDDIESLIGPLLDYISERFSL
jgi:protein-tyrosine-phosphatase